MNPNSKTVTRNTLAGTLAVATIIGAGMGAAQVASAHDRITDAQSDCGTYSGEGCAPLESRIDLEPPQFSNPTEITNPLFPISALQAVAI